MTSIQAQSQNTFRISHPLIISGVEKLCAFIYWLISLLTEKKTSSNEPSLQGRVVALKTDSVSYRDEINSAVDTLKDYLYTLPIESPGVVECFTACDELQGILEKNPTNDALIKHIHDLNLSVLEIEDSSNLEKAESISLEREFLDSLYKLDRLKNQLTT